MILKTENITEEYNPIIVKDKEDKEENLKDHRDHIINEYRKLDEKCEQILRKIKTRQSRKLKFNDTAQE